MSRLPRATGKQLARVLARRGYRLVSVHGSHHKFCGPHGGTIVVPIHGNRSISIGIIHDIVTRKLKMTAEEFAEMLRE